MTEMFMCSLKEIIEAAAAQARSQMDADPDIKAVAQWLYFQRSFF